MKAAEQFEAELLDLIDNRDRFQRSDLKTLVKGLVQKIMLSAVEEE